MRIDSTVVSFTLSGVLSKLFYYLSLDFSLAFPLLSPKANLVKPALWFPILMRGNTISRLHTLESWTSYLHCCWSLCAACLLSLRSPSFHQTLIMPGLLCWPPANHCICSLCPLCSFIRAEGAQGTLLYLFTLAYSLGALSTPGNPANMINMPLCSSAAFNSYIGDFVHAAK